MEYGREEGQHDALGRCGNESVWSILAGQFSYGLLVEFCHPKLFPLLGSRLGVRW